MHTSSMREAILEVNMKIIIVDDDRLVGISLKTIIDATGESAWLPWGITAVKR
jgi:hypothetical protein